MDKMVEYNINSVEDCLIALGSKKPFFKNIKYGIDGNTDSLTKTGNIAYSNLVNIVTYLQEINVVDNFNVDLLDSIVDSDF